MSWEHLNQVLENYLHHAWAALLALALVGFVWLLPAPARQAAWQTLTAEGFAAQRNLAGMLFFFSLLALSLLWSGGQRIDAWVFHFINWRGRRPKWLDRLMWAITHTGTGALALLFVLYYWQRGDRLLANQMALGSLSLWLMVELVKALVRRPRPFIHLAQTRIVGQRAIGRSFPSGHTGQSFFQFTLLVQHFHLGLGPAALLYALAALVGLTRMYVGAHYPRDVLAGAILGTAWAFITLIFQI